MKKIISHQLNKYFWQVANMSPATRRMKPIYILLFVCLLSGCKVKKDLSVKTESVTELTEQKDIKQSERTRTDSIGKQEIDKDEVLEGVTVTYDTEKPIDPATGKPPVKSETKWIRTKKEKVKEETAQVTQKDVQSQDKSRTDARQAEQVKIVQSQKKDVFRIPWLWICIGAIGIVGIVYYIRRRV